MDVVQKIEPQEGSIRIGTLADQTIRQQELKNKILTHAALNEERGRLPILKTVPRKKLVPFMNNVNSALATIQIMSIEQINQLAYSAAQLEEVSKSVTKRLKFSITPFYAANDNTEHRSLSFGIHTLKNRRSRLNAYLLEKSLRPGSMESVSTPSAPSAEPQLKKTVKKHLLVLDQLRKSASASTAASNLKLPALKHSSASTTHMQSLQESSALDVVVHDTEQTSLLSAQPRQTSSNVEDPPNISLMVNLLPQAQSVPELIHHALSASTLASTGEATPEMLLAVPSASQEVLTAHSATPNAPNPNLEPIVRMAKKQQSHRHQYFSAEPRSTSAPASTGSDIVSPVPTVRSNPGLPYRSILLRFRHPPYDDDYTLRLFAPVSYSFSFDGSNTNARTCVIGSIDINFSADYACFISESAFPAFIFCWDAATSGNATSTLTYSPVRLQVDFNSGSTSCYLGLS
ncbi:hypothetical protein JRQ81_012327 [Phrynocephalus forsythii]|uniref:Uncharacterized protein n=1 Tax=Phrynocephalus forsythii TaxID=171643 RepID=A0A9Q1AQ31_9SAUR|nr:hypothetical protein JRQ81_012327 [Phrynocephalus forsythii]